MPLICAMYNSLGLGTNLSENSQSRTRETCSKIRFALTNVLSVLLEQITVLMTNVL